MKITLCLKPTPLKCAVPLLIVGASLLLPLRGYTWLFFQILWLPFSLFMNVPPFVAIDKPWYIMPPGAVFAAVCWAILLYLLLSIRIKRGTETRKS